jgi:small subunit ribosomal protein S3
MMAVEKIFIKEGVKESEVEEYLAKKFDKAGYSHTEIQRTPLGTRIIVYAHKPGLVIGRSGKRITDITEEIKQKFGFENPLIDVREVEQPFTDANIVAKRIARSIEDGINFKKVANYYMDMVMQAGAIGVSIKIGGKIAGTERSRFQKFKKGFIAHSGDYAETLVDKGYAQANIKPGIVGIQVKIMKQLPKEVEEKEFKVEKEIEKQEKSGETEEQK